MKTIRQVLVTIFVGLSALPFLAAETPNKQSYEQYLRESPVPREVIL